MPESTTDTPFPKLRCAISAPSRSQTQKGTKALSEARYDSAAADDDLMVETMLMTLEET